MRVTTERIENGSHVVRVFCDDNIHAPIDVSLILQPVRTPIKERYSAWKKRLATRKYRFSDRRHDKAFVFLRTLFDLSAPRTVDAKVAHGILSPEINIAIGMEAYELGYQIMTFKAVKGSKVTRWAERTHSDTHFDHYRVNIPQVMKTMGIN